MTTARDFRKLDVAIVVLSAITYLIDVATDVLVTVQYMFEGELMWFTLTLAFIVVPMVLMQVFSLKWYLAEANARISFLSGFLHSIGLALLKRYANVLMTWSDVKTSADPALIEKLFLQINDVFLLRLFQCFLESAPQLILHSYVSVSQWYITISSGCSIFFSLVSLAWGFATYTDILRLTYRDSYHRKWSGLLLQVGWQIGMVISRVMALVMFGVCFHGWLFLPIAIHWLLMTIWIMAEKTNFSSNWWEDKLYSCVVGFIYIFCFLNVQEGRTRWRMFFFYALQMLENTLIVITWMLVNNSMQFIYQWVFTAIVYIGFLGGIVCLLLFYGCYHPDKQDEDNSSGELGQEQSKQTFQSLRRSSKRVEVSSSSITSNTSLMDKDGNQTVYKPFPYRKEPIGCPDVSADIRFLKINDGTPSFNSIGKFPAFNHGMLQDEEDVDESATKIFSSTAVDEETPRGLKFVKRTQSQNILKNETLLASGQMRGEPKVLSSKFTSSMSQPGLFSKGIDREVKITPHIGYSPEKAYMLKLTSPPPCRDPRNCHTLGRHHSENIRSTTQVSTVDDLSQKYQHFRESWDGSDRYLQMLEKYCDREDQPVKYTYLNSVYEPTTKPMERKNKVSPLTKLRSSFRRHINAMRNINYKEMSPVLNPKQYFSSQGSLKSNPGPSLLQCQNLPLTEAFHSGENQHGMFYSPCHPKDHIGNSQKCCQESAYRGSQSCADPSQCHRHCQGYEQTSFCDHGFAHKRRSYTENFHDGQQQINNAPYHHIQKPTNPENINSQNDNALTYFNAADRCGYYNQPTHLSYLTLPHKPNNFPSSHSASSAFAQCYPTLRKPQGPYPPNHNYPSNDQSTYVVYSEKPAFSRCTSAPPHLPQNYGSLRRNPIGASRKTPDDALVDHNDFRYCTVSSVRSESAPPDENYVRASFRSQRGLKLRSDSFKSNHEAATYDFRQLTVSPVQSMSVPPDKINDLEALRNLTVSPVRSVSVMPNQSQLQEQEYFGIYSQQTKRPTSVPPNYFQTYNPSNFPVPRVSSMSNSPDTSFSYSTGADRPTTPSSSQCCSDNFIYGKMTVSTDGMVSIPPATSNSKTVPPSFDSAGHNHQDEVSDSPMFSHKRPYLPDIKLSVPYSPTQSDISLDSDSQSIISFSSLPDSTSESLPRDRTRVKRNSGKESAEADPQFYEDQSSGHRKNSNPETKCSKNGITLANGVSRHETVKEEFNQLHHPETSKTNSSDAKNIEKGQDPLQSTNKLKSIKKMSSHVHRGVSIEPSSSDYQTAHEDDPKESQDASSLKGPQEIQADALFTVPLKPPSIHPPEEIIKKQETISSETVSSGSEPNLSGIFNQQFTQSYAKIDPNQFSLQKFRDCTRSELYSPGISKTSTKKISSVDFYNKSIPNKNSSEKSANSFYSLPSPEIQRENGEERENERKKPQIPKNLPEEKPKMEQPLKNKNATLSPLTIKQLKSSPVKLGRSLSISSGDKSRLSKLRDKLSPLRIQNLVHSPFKFGRNIDLFDRKRWRSANDIVEEANVDKKISMLVNGNKVSEKNKSTPKNKESASAMSDREAFNAKYLHGEESETDSDPSGLGTLMDCDWAHDVLDQLSRISDQHGSSFSDDSLKFTKFASWTDLTDLPRQEMVKETSDGKGDLDGISKHQEEVKTNGIDPQEAMGNAEVSVNKMGSLNSNLDKKQTLSTENLHGRESASDKILEVDCTSNKAIKKSTSKEDISKAENINRNQINNGNVFEEMVEKSANENSVAEELNSRNKITYQEFEQKLRNSKDDSFFKENNETFIVSQASSDESMKKDFCRDEDNTDNCSYQCDEADSADSTEHDSNKSMMEKLKNSESPPKTRTKTYNAGKTTEPKRSRRQNQELGNKCRKKLTKELCKNNKINAIYKNLYHDVELSVVHEDLISVRDDTQYTQNMACWETWDKYEDDENDDENLERFKNNLIRETLSSEMSCPWENSITDSDENDSSREGAVSLLDKAFLSDDDKYDSKTNSYWPRSRYPKTVSRSVDPLLMPTIHEYKIMTEQFVYDDDEDDETDSYHFDDPQLTVPAYELYDDRRSKINKYSSYFREKSLQSVNDTHSPMYMTVPIRDSSRAWNSMNQKSFVLEEFFPKSETESSEAHAFL